MQYSPGVRYTGESNSNVVAELGLMVVVVVTLDEDTVDEANGNTLDGFGKPFVSGRI
jgi:hypothetical protein